MNDKDESDTAEEPNVIEVEWRADINDSEENDPHNLLTAKDSGVSFDDDLKTDLRCINGVIGVHESGSGHKLRVVFNINADSQAIREVEDRLGSTGRMSSAQEGFPVVEYTHEEWDGGD